ncbi:hypothetical protein PVT67_18340 [Gallaecimonas kandeliae]|uniref:hypothetical protein n=1 Tax=Gallaecimonas kandeliae TaxID=3029055 RepID=UPI00264A091D|nr:hypothetical protein [Gallaecimonas kandeliae]WKE65597.1 hypothetical protein PVT67_18340 [Gallaecimonas kandeliae]
MKALIPLALLASAAFTCQAGEIDDAIKAAQDAYQKGDLSNAAGQFEYAATLIRQEQGQQLTKLLPQPLDGWQAEEAQNDSTSGAIMGGGIQVSRVYRKGDDVSLELTLFKDSPMMQAMMGIFSNPGMAVMAGYKVKKVKGVNAMLKPDDMSLSLMKGTLMVQLQCDGCQEPDLLAYANLLDLDAMAKI